MKRHGSIIAYNMDINSCENFALEYINSHFDTTFTNINEANGSDLLIIRPGDNGYIGIDLIHSVSKKLAYKPYQAKSVVIIILQSEAMTMEAQNAFLKTLEEPPDFASILLLTNSIDNLLDTIVSRCRLYKIQSLKQPQADSTFDIKEYLDSDIATLFTKASKLHKSKTRKGDSLILIEELQRYFHTKLLESTEADTTKEVKSVLDKLQKASHMVRRNVNIRLVLEYIFLEINNFSSNAKIRIM